MTELNDELDGCSVDTTEELTSDEEVVLLPLFAEAIDPNNDKTVQDVVNEWEGIDASPTSD